MLDAFSSDAIPIHLMTREAMAIYVSKLAPRGIVMMHVSNRHMEFSSVVAGIAHANGLVSRVNNRAARDDEDDAKYVFTSTVVISAREEKDFGQLREDADWSELEIDANQRIWTDDYSNVIGAIVRNLTQGPPVARQLGGMTHAVRTLRLSQCTRREARRRARPAGRASRMAFALFAHCFTCGKDVLAAKRIAEGLTMRGIAVLRFDFTGLGASEGEFANTTFSSNVADLVAAANHLRKMHQAPAILIGHSLGGAAVLAAAQHCPEARAVVTIAAPADPAHVTGLFREHIPEIEEKGEVEVALAGRPFRIRKEFLDDVAKQKLEQCLAQSAQGAAGDAFADRRSRRHRERERDLHRREAPEELRLAQRRRSSARQARATPSMWPR